MVDRKFVMAGIDVKIVHSPFHKLVFHPFGLKIFFAELLRLFRIKTAAGIDINGDKILFGESMDDHGTLDQGDPAGKAGLLGIQFLVAPKNIRGSLFFHAKIIHDLIQKLITKVQVVTNTGDTIVKIQ